MTTRSHGTVVKVDFHASEVVGERRKPRGGATLPRANLPRSDLGGEEAITVTDRKTETN